MNRNAPQRERSVNNPLNLGSFDQLSLRYLKGSLGPQSKVVGRKDRWDQSNGGFGQDTYNHWFQVSITDPSWIIVTKGPPRPKYINVSVFDANKTELIGLPVFQGDSIQATSTEGEVYFPYLDTAASRQSDLYNTFDRYRLDRGDDKYFPLQPGKYLICISTTRNEPLNYEVGVVIEPREAEVVILCEDGVEVTYLIQEDESNPELILCDYDDAFLDTFHEHSLDVWQTAWYRDHQQKDRFPAVFVPLCSER